MAGDPSTPESRPVTRLLELAAAGDGDASAALYQQVYDALRGMAQRHLAGERSGHTLQATALVHEAYVRLLGVETNWSNSAHFFHAAAQCMRRILIDHAKSRNRAKRGGGVARVELGDWIEDLKGNAVELARDGDPGVFLAVDRAICRLEEEDPEAGEVVRLRYFAGLTEEQVAKALSLSERTVRRRWQFAKAWLFDAMQNATSVGDEADEPEAKGGT
ncbi:MAG: ECF-type sigma factor [Phycisphaerales bacterium]